MNHPFPWLVDHRAVWLGLLWAATLALATVLSIRGKSLQTPDAPRGVLSLELAWSQAGADAVLGSWSESLRDEARTQIRLDFLFLVVYPLALSLSCAWLAESPLDSMAPAGVFIAWAVLLAGPLDLIENVTMLRMISAGATTALARLAAWCAGLKFTLVFAALGYLVLQGLAVAGAKLKGG
jgi:hypothetical protein